MPALAYIYGGKYERQHSIVKKHFSQNVVLIQSSKASVLTSPAIKHKILHTPGCFFLLNLCKHQFILKKLLRYIPGAAFSLSKNFPRALVICIIEETGVERWKAGEKINGESQS